MALITTIKLLDNFDIEVSIPNVYIRIDNISGGKLFLNITASYKKGVDQEPFKTFTFSFAPTLDGANFIAQGYDYLKTLPEFADAVDC